MTQYYRPLVQVDPARPDHAAPLAGGWAWFVEVECLSRTNAPVRMANADVPADVLKRLTDKRPPIAGLDWAAPKLMGVINTTPDSFSDGGSFHAAQDAIEQGEQLAAHGADILDIGGESTRPGADYVEIEAEIERTAPVIKGLRAAGSGPISIDTRKAAVGNAALAAGATLINDVAAFTHDPALLQVAVEAAAPICVMHAQGQPKNMQAAPHYDNVLLDVYDFLAERVEAAVSAGVPRDQIIVDPGIGFGKTIQHNLALLRGLALLHGLGCPILLGASRKRFIGTIAGVPNAQDRMPGTLAVTLHGVSQGVQLHRVHDIQPIKQALDLHEAVVRGWNSND